jgi:hypothetical protein
MPAMHKFVYNIPLSRLTSYAKEIIGDHQCGFWYNLSTADHIFRIHKIHDNEAVHQLFIDFKKAYDSVRRDVMYNLIK